MQLLLKPVKRALYGVALGRSKLVLDVDFFYLFAYTTSRQENWLVIAIKVMQKANPRRGRLSSGVLLCLLALAVTVKPLANVVGNYTC